MRFGAVLVIAAVSLACGVDRPAAGGSAIPSSLGGFFRQYEYEEEMFLSLDRSATIYVNSSVPALNALRGTSLDARPNARRDRIAAAVRAYFGTPVTEVERVTSTRRRNRVFVHVRVKVADVGRLHEAPAFAWSAYRFARQNGRFVFRQTIGRSAHNGAAYDGWTGDELVAFRIHVPSKVEYHNAGPDNLKRGNILVWEQPLTDRQRGLPLELEARMETESILYRTLWLFAATGAAVAALFTLLIWWIVRSGGRRQATEAAR
jgi:hypothetical protein